MLDVKIDDAALSILISFSSSIDQVRFQMICRSGTS